MKPHELFSTQAQDYAKYRPKYPDELFAFLSSIVPSHERAWDCATGNGQAAIGLTNYFEKIYATDISQEQISHAISNPKIKYFAAPAEDSKIDSSSIDLITVGTAIHWFDRQRFFNEVKRILKPNGILAVWNYTNMTFINRKIDEIILNFNEKILTEKYWHPSALNIFRDGYKNLEIPFKKIKTPDFKMCCFWTFDEFVNYLHTWSGFQSYIKINKTDPIELIYKELKDAWGEIKRREVKWDLLLKVGKKSSSNP